MATGNPLEMRGSKGKSAINRILSIAMFGRRRATLNSSVHHESKSQRSWAMGSQQVPPFCWETPWSSRGESGLSQLKHGEK